MILIVLSAVLLLFYTLTTFYWYTTPTHIQISGMQGVNINIETPQKHVILEKEEKEKLVNILKRNKII